MIYRQTDLVWLVRHGSRYGMPRFGPTCAVSLYSTSVVGLLTSPKQRLAAYYLPAASGARRDSIWLCLANVGLKLARK